MNTHGHYENKEPNNLGKYHGDQLVTFFYLPRTMKAPLLNCHESCLKMYVTLLRVPTRKERAQVSHALSS